MTIVVADTTPRTRLDAARTLARMHELVRSALPKSVVWERARAIVGDVPPRHEVEQAVKIRAWCALNFRFVNDPLDVQLLTEPTYLLEHIARQGYAQGNCADAAMLTASLCLAIHIPCKFVAVAFNSPSAPYAHVFAMAYPRTPAGHAAVELDITRPPGVKHAKFTRRLLEDA